MASKVTAHAYDWTVEDAFTHDEHVAIHAWCLNRESEPLLIRVEDFPAFCHVELPLYVNMKPMLWTGESVRRVFEWLCQVLKEDMPIGYNFLYLSKLYYYKGTRKYPMMRLFFKNLKSLQHCEKLLSKKSYRIDDLGGMIFFLVWETSISIVRKLLTVRDCGYSQWFTIEAIEVPPDEHISTLEKEYIGNWRTLTPLTEEETKGWVTYPRILAFDIECYSPNYKAMPNQTSALHVAYAISLIYQRANQPETRKRYAILLGDCDDVKLSPRRPGPKKGDPDEPTPGDVEVTVIRVKSEEELINEMSRLVRELDPEVITGYNILGFDYSYLDARLKRRVKTWQPMGRLLGKIPTLKSQSGAYGHNDINILLMDGRINIDLYPLIRRDYKMDKYDLGTVSRTFLGENRDKHDIKAAEMFAIYDQMKMALAQPENEEQLVKAKREMTRVMRYCIQDSELVIELFDRLNVWIGLIELSNIVGVTVMDLFTRGQQVRCFSQIYDLAFKRGYVIDDRVVPHVRFAGGFVYDPIPGLYENIICLDFASLYPSIIQAYNICWTTLVPPELDTDIPDDQCTVFDFDQEEVPVSPKNSQRDEGTSDEEESDIDEDDEPGELSQKAKKRLVHRHFKFVKSEVSQGLLPHLVRNLVERRRAVRRLLDGVRNEETGEWVLLPEKDPVTKIILDKRQNALKVTANSFFGFLGVNGGKLPLIEGAMAITYKGRELIGKVSEYLATKYQSKIVYGDTDSCMVDLNIKDPKECHSWGMRLSEEISGNPRKGIPGLFPPPLRMEFEKAMRLLCLRKKKYAAVLIDKNGKHKTEDKDIFKRGIILARRDNCKWIRNVYLRLLKHILLKGSMVEAMDIIIDAVKELIEGRISYKDLIIIRTLGANYKQDTYFMKVFSDQLRKIGKPANPGDRLEYLIVSTPNPDEKIGLKMRLPETYLEQLSTPQEEKIDYLYYLEHMMINPIDQLFEVAYRKELEEFKDVGYKPHNRCKFKSISKPVTMMLYILRDGEDISLVRHLIRRTRFPRLKILSLPTPEESSPSKKTTDRLVSNSPRLKSVFDVPTKRQDDKPTKIVVLD